MDSVAKQDLRVKLEFMFRQLYDLRNVLTHLSFDEDFNNIMMSQVLTIGVKVIHQTRIPGQVDPDDQPNMKVIEVGRATQKAFTKVFEELEAKRALTTAIPIMVRQAPIYRTYIEQLVVDIERIYDAPMIIRPGLEVNHG